MLDTVHHLQYILNTQWFLATGSISIFWYTRGLLSWASLWRLLALSNKRNYSPLHLMTDTDPISQILCTLNILETSNNFQHTILHATTIQLSYTSKYKPESICSLGRERRLWYILHKRVMFTKI